MLSCQYGVTGSNRVSAAVCKVLKTCGLTRKFDLNRRPRSRSGSAPGRGRVDFYSVYIEDRTYRALEGCAGFDVGALRGDLG